MTLNSKYFDQIRVKPDQQRQARTENPCCEWKGCNKPGAHPAPKGRGREGQYFSFCIQHVREYNKSYNFFKGMSPEDADNFREEIITGHRPTRKFGVNAKSDKVNAQDKSENDTEFLRRFREAHSGPGNHPGGFSHNFTHSDPYRLFGGENNEAAGVDHKPARTVRNLERKSLTALNLDIYATAKEIKTRFKELVKRHHPDIAGDRGSQDKLREVIQAYNYLKQAGLC